jgi:hypothetical protein
MSSESPDFNLYEQLKSLPDFNKLPLPDSWYKKFNIPRPEAVSFQSYAMERRWLAHKYDSDLTYEVRTEPAPGGVRPILEAPEIPVTIETSSENQQSTTEESADSTAPTETVRQQSEADPSVQSSDAD